MLQRKQTIFLMLVAFLMLGSLFTAGWSRIDTITGQKATLTAYELIYINPQASEEAQRSLSSSTFYIAGLAVLAAVLATYSMMSYRNRLRQLKLGAVNSIVIALTVGLILYHGYQAEALFAGTEAGGTFGIGFFLCLTAFVLNMIANHFVRQDEKLVKSMDRFR